MNLPNQPPKGFKQLILNKVKRSLLVVKKRKKIDFIIVGTQKGGTSALDYYLRKHSQIGMAKVKEVHFFDNELLFSASKINYLQYDIQFQKSPAKKIYGEVTPIYMYWEPCCKRIYDYNPNIKLIFILRNPLHRALSHWNMEFDRKLETESFGYAIRNELERTKATSQSQHRVYSYIDRGLYANQIKRFRTFFSENQLLFIKYEDFYINQERVLNSIFNFLEVDSTNFNFERKTIHRREKHAFMSLEDKAYLMDKFKADIREVEKMLNWDCSDWLE